jgi:hypothetical protein
LRRRARRDIKHSCYSTCIFCHAALGTNDAIEHFPIGRRLAFDVARGRLWVICTDCAQWNLSPLEERWEAIDECERQFRGTFVRVSTPEIGLARLRDGLELVRVGKPLRPEFAAWRYGRQFARRRKRTHLVAGTGIAAAAVAGLAVGPAIAPALTLGTISIIAIPGLTTVMGVIPLVGMLAMRDYIQHDRVVARIPNGSGGLLMIRARHLGDVELSVPHRGAVPEVAIPHDGGWATFEGGAAMHATGLIVAGANRFGAPATSVQDAVRQIERAGDASGFLAEASTRNAWRGRRVTSLVNRYRGLGALQLAPAEQLALEMSVHEESERSAMEGELAVLEDAWRGAEEIARISDEDLTPPKLYE